jgi:hypothetical protein
MADIQEMSAENITQYHRQQSQRAASDSSLDDFIHSRTRILRTKLEVLASEIRERLQIRVKNLERVADDKIHITAMLVDLDRRANYLTREHKEKSPFYEQLFKLEQEKRLQDVECWRDVVMVMRDFLYAWEAHEQAKVKAIFLDHV